MTAHNHPVTTDRFTSQVDSPLTRRAVVRGFSGMGLAAMGLALTSRNARQVSADLAEPAMGTEDVITAYLSAVNAHDLEGILGLYTEDAIHVALPTPDGSAGVCRGKSQFRMWYEQAIANGDQIELVDRSLQVRHGRATFVVRITSGPWTELGLGPQEASVEAVVVDGLIQTHIVMLAPSGVRELLTAQEDAPKLSTPRRGITH